MFDWVFSEFFRAWWLGISVVGLRERVVDMGKGDGVIFCWVEVFGKEAAFVELEMQMGYGYCAAGDSGSWE